MRETDEIPCCLVFSAHDPSGGAGVQADITALAAGGCHAVTVLTGLSVQDTRDVYRVVAADSALLAEQAQALLADMPVAAIKIGLLPNADIVAAVHAVVGAYPHLPLVLDPIMRAGGGAVLQAAGTAAAMQRLLFPLATVLTP